jgi:hypothetical protein
VTEGNVLHSAVFVPRLGGDTPDGLDWEEFLEAHRQALEEHGRQGRRLVTAIPVTYQQGKLGGVLLYFSAPEGAAGQKAGRRLPA